MRSHIDVCSSFEGLGSGLFAGGSISMRKEDVLNSIAVRSNPLFFARPVPVFSENGLQKIWIRTGGHAV